MAQTRAMLIEQAENFALMYSNAVEKRVIRIITNGLSRYIYASERDNSRFDRIRFLREIYKYINDASHFIPTESEREEIYKQWEEFFHIVIDRNGGEIVRLFPQYSAV